MGLDSYINRTIFLKPNINKKLREIGLNFIEEDDNIHITQNVGYLRKANQIHYWFVENVQNGIDDCKEYSFDIEILKELKNICEEILKLQKKLNKTKNEKQKKEILEQIQFILPTKQGFFFGNTQYDEDYFAEVDEALIIINNILKFEILNKLKNNEHILYHSYSYQSSW